MLVHTRMVCRELAGMPLFHRLDSEKRTALFLAAVLHDLGKVKTTRPENGIVVSPHHAASGSRMVRVLLWREFWHMFPLRLMEREDAERKIRKIAAAGELAADFSWSLLCALAEADMRGRVADDVAEGLERVELARMAAEDAGCDHALRSSRNRKGYLDPGKLPRLPGGFPGRYPRGAEDRSGRRPGDGRTACAGARAGVSSEEAAVRLERDLPDGGDARKADPAVRAVRARVRIVWLETDWNTRAERNRNRKNAVPEAVVDRMLGMAVPPFPDEAQTVEWICV